ncbi:sulfurtransferase [Virgibacillus alimentarius]|uniref:Thiosulfate/3-mercaptopyruvate sulfurtransferase n=1 Tax=Virgibacillus alimentarius TaxID=698769 RepID=A0ABS4S6X2_9BACI|nr:MULTISPECIES: sulfurtransferase [Virgibacillus]MBP2257231.1 thiosulfate/3-mercaptopyruvate sulfurtransferase [Virgibacillus alimentarius]HLR67386.1 sulfurtransferase [Virgibacillus sp.]
MSSIITVDRLKRRLQNDQNNTMIIDARFQLNDPDAGRKAYLDGHIPGAVYLDLDKDLSGRIAKHGGSHPLPDIDTFVAKIGHIGIDNDTTVVVYDQHNDMFAARCWWLLHYIGHEKVYVLEGGYNEWIANGNEVTTDLPKLTAKEFKPALRTDEVVDIQDVKEKKEETVLIDSRAKDRYLGQQETRYKRAGHIPGAKNYFWKDVLTNHGKWKNKDELDRHFEQLDKDNEVIVSCGSGVSACPNIMALKIAGFQNVKLYPGSFSDWISYDENKIETKEE